MGAEHAAADRAAEALVAVDLPELPQTRANAMALLLRQDVALAELVIVIECDPALTVAVMRAANSAYSSPAKPVQTAADSIVRLGLTGIRRIVVGMMLQHSFDESDDGPLDLNEMWRYLLATALLADAAIWIGGEPSEDVCCKAFTAGMLHKIGRLAMVGADPERYGRVVDLVRSGWDELEAERTEWGQDHVPLGVRAGAAWGIPDEVLTAISGQYGSGSTAVADALYRGRQAALALGYGDGLTVPGDGEHVLSPSDEALVAHVGGPERLAERIDWYRGALSG